MTSTEVRAVISQELGFQIGEVDPNLADLGVDSLDYLDLVNKLEHASGKDVPTAGLAKFKTVGDLERFFA